MKKLSYILLSITIFSTALFTGCNPLETAKPSPLFPGTEVITITSSATSNPITWTMPDVKYEFIIVGIFTAAPSVVNGILTAAPAGGSRSGLAGFSNGSVAKADIKIYEISTNDFTGSTYAPGAGRWIAIWAYDGDWNLVASSTSAATTINM